MTQRQKFNKLISFFHAAQCFINSWGSNTNGSYTKVLLFTLMVSIASSSAVHAENTVRVGGAGAGLGTIKKLADAFEKTYPGTKITVMPSLGSSGGIKALLHGALDVAISGRALKEDELQKGAVASEFASTPFIFAVHKNVPKTDITVSELEKIYYGRQLKWPDGSLIRLVLRPTGDTDTTIVKGISKEMEHAVKAANSRPDMIIAVTDQEAADAVAKIPGAIGTTTLAQTRTETHPLKVLSFNGVPPTIESFASGRYPLTKPLYLVTTRNTSAPARQFIRFISSPKGRSILAQSGTMPAAGGTRTK